LPRRDNRRTGRASRDRGWHEGERRGASRRHSCRIHRERAQILANFDRFAFGRLPAPIRGPRMGPHRQRRWT
jgi:hypothetical protein